jgi:hypothetical protein
MLAGAALLTVLAGFMVLQSQSQAPFKFLEGQIAMEEPPRIQRQYGEDAPRVRIYSFRANFPDLIRRIAPELKAEGYTDVTLKVGDIGDQVRYFARGDIASFASSTARKRVEVETVFITRDTRCHSTKRGRIDWSRQAGYVTVRAQTDRDTGVLAKLRAWIGL